MKILILVVFVVDVCIKKCSAGAEKYTTDLYTYEANPTPKTWDNANKWCGIKNGTLAVLNTLHLVNKVRQVLVWNSKFWIGYRCEDLSTCGWVKEGIKLESLLTIQKPSPNHKCYTLRRNSSDFHLQKGQCSKSKKFICEFPNHISGTIDTSSPANKPTSTLHQAIAKTTTAVSCIVQATPALSSSSPMDKNEATSTQPSHHSQSTGLFMKITQNINPATTSSVLPSTAAKPQSTAKPSKTDYQGNENMINRFHIVMENLNTSHPDCMSTLLAEYDNLMEWMDNKNEDMEYNPLTDARDIEDIALEFTKHHLDSNRKKMSISKKEITFHAILIDSDGDADVTFPDVGEDPDVNTISLPKSLFKGQVTYIVNVEFKNTKTLPKLAPKVMEGQDDAEKNWTVNTGIFSTTIFPKRKEPFEYVNITLRHIQKLKDAKPHCSFWNYSIPTSHNGSWSEHGCYVVSHTETETVCACNHLTNFAVLMNLNSEKVPSVHKDALMVITYVGLGLSLLGEAITVLLYCFFLNLRHEKIQIRVNLLCVLAAAQIVFLAGIDKIENKGLCTFVAALIHLLYLVCFCWMLMEGVYLYRMVVQVFDAHVNMRYSYIFAFGLPSCVVVVSLIAAAAKSDGIYSYISSEYCWMRLDNGFIWSFIVPMLMLIAINTFFLFSVLKEMALMKSVKTINSLELSSIRASARACVVLLPLLGITWVFGLLSLISSGVWWQYIFTIFNAMQGFMIFLFHCLRNTELRAAIELRYFQWESTHSHGQNRSITPSKFVAFEESEKSRSNSIPMATKGNQVTPT